jgi:hypothetical protein
LTKTGISAAGELTLRGMARLANVDLETAAFVVVGRKTKSETEYPAQWTGKGQQLEVSGRIPLTALDIAGDNLADVYFIGRGSGRETRTRVAWDRGVAHWLPYPTKLGNLSLKRKDS